MGAVVEEQGRPPQRGQPAEGVADVVVELPRLGGGVDLREQPDEDVDRVRSRR
jgi:hypothetical protein